MRLRRGLSGVIFISIIVAGAAGCQSGSKQIAGSASKARARITAINQNAAEGRENVARAIGDYNDGNDPTESLNATDGNLAAIQSEATGAAGDVENIQTAIPQIQDKPSAMLSTIWWVAVAAAGVAGLVFLWRSGILALIGAAVGLVTPSVKSSAAKLLAENKTAEAVAVLREDKQFDAAFQKANTETKLNNKKG